ALLALFDDQLAAPEPPLHDAVGDHASLVGREHREQRDAPDQVQIRKHRHSQSPFRLSLRAESPPKPDPAVPCRLPYNYGRLRCIVPPSIVPSIRFRPTTFE